MLGACCLVALARRQPSKAGHPRAVALRAQSESGTGTAVLERGAAEEERFRALCTTLLRECGKAEEILSAAKDGEEPSDVVLDFHEFENLLKKLKVQCEASEAKELFSMLDEDGGGTIDVQELKRSLRNSGVITEMYSEGLKNSALTLIPALLLAVGFSLFKGASAGFDFLAGYVVEDSLSVDNLFVFLIIFKYFQVPPALQKRCLDLGIYGAVVLRALFIFVGLAAVNSFKPVLLIFAGILLYASYSSFSEGEDDDDEEDEGPPDVIKDIVDALPCTPTFVDDKLFVRDDSGGWLVTPLFLCILSIELSDILFAVDSVPAVFAVTDDPLIVFTSNIAAILGLRSLYQVLSIAVQDLVYLEKSVSVILGFVGLKLVGEVAGFEISSGLSLLFIISTLSIGIGASVLEESSGKDSAKKKGKSTIEKLVEAGRKLFQQK